MKKRFLWGITIIAIMIITIGVTADNSYIRDIEGIYKMDLNKYAHRTSIGDVNTDNKINAEDSLLVMKNIAKIIEFDDEHKYVADVDGDGIVDSRDSLNILEYAARIIDDFDRVAIATDPPLPTVMATETPDVEETATPAPAETLVPVATQIPSPKPTELSVEYQIPYEYRMNNISGKGTITCIEYPSCDYYNTNKEIKKDAYVYLPYGYNQTQKYNVVYFMHGVGGTKDEWGVHKNGNVLKNVLDNLIADGTIEPVIAVFPTGRSCTNYNDMSNFGMNNNMGAFYLFGKELRNDLIPYIDKYFSTYADYEEGYDISLARDHRAMIGFSMGGMQTINIGLCECLDIIGSFGALSSAPTTYTADRINDEIKYYNGYDINLFYNICGTSDSIAYQSHLNAIEDICQGSDNRLVEKINYIWQITNGGHTHEVWQLGAYNFMKLVFK